MGVASLGIDLDVLVIGEASRLAVGGAVGVASRCFTGETALVVGVVNL